MDTLLDNPEKRRAHRNLRRQLVADFAHNMSRYGDLDSAPTVNLTLLGEPGSGKSTLLGRLLVGSQALSKGTELLERQPSEAMPALVRTADGVAQIIDTPSPRYFKNALKQLVGCDHVILCVRAKHYAESGQRADRKKGVVNGQCVVMGHCMCALIESKVHIVCVTQMDAPGVAFAAKQFEQCKTAVLHTLGKRGYKRENLIFIPVCALNVGSDGGNVCAANTSHMAWFKGFEVTGEKQTFSGKTLRDAIDVVSRINALKRNRRAKLPLRMLVTGKYQVKGVGDIVQGA